MPSLPASWEDSIGLINASLAPCAGMAPKQTNKQKNLVSGVVVEQGSEEEFEQMIWTSHFPSLGTSVSLLYI